MHIIINNVSILSGHGSGVSLSLIVVEHRHCRLQIEVRVAREREIPAFTYYASSFKTRSQRRHRSWTSSDCCSEGQAPAAVLPELLVIVVGVAEGMLLLLVPAVRVPGAAGAGRGAHRNTGGEAEETSVRSAASGSGLHGNIQPNLSGSNHRISIPHHPHALHRRQPQQGRNQVRRVQLHGHVQRHATGEGDRAWLLPGCAQYEERGGHHLRR